jgi:hypothetical protein
MEHREKWLQNKVCCEPEGRGTDWGFVHPVDWDAIFETCYLNDKETVPLPESSSRINYFLKDLTHHPMYCEVISYHTYFALVSNFAYIFHMWSLKNKNLPRVRAADYAADMC